MALYLVQHGKSLSKEQDPEKGLSEEGSQEVSRIAKMAADAGIPLSSIRHSGKKRAQQTAELFDAALQPPAGVSTADGIGPLDDVAAFSERIDPNENVMVVGHLPFMEKLTSYLITGDSDRTVFRFQNGGIVCMDKDGEGGTWRIAWSAMPTIG